MGADPDKTVRFLTLAGDQALEAGAGDEALRLFTEALSIQEDGDDRRKLADLQYRKGLALRSLGRSEEAVDAWRPALAAYEALDDVEGIARTAYDVADQTSWLPGQARAAANVARRALDLVGDRDAAARCRMLALFARFSSLAGVPYEVSRGALVEAETLAASLDRPELTAEVLSARTRFHWSYAQFPQAIEVGRRGMALRTERGELYEAVELKWQVCASALLAGRLREADEMVAELEPEAERVGNMGASFAWRWSRKCHHFVTAGDLVASDQRWGRLIEWCEQHGPAFVAAVFTLRGWVRFCAGDWEAARADYDSAVRLDNPSFTDGWFSTVGLVAGAYAGDDVLARLQAARVQALGDARGQPGWAVGARVQRRGGPGDTRRTREGRRSVSRRLGRF
jgi:tetratricopeptide (TPR) repeat protein